MKIEIECERCGEVFEREKKEVNRSRKLGRKMYCGMECYSEVSKYHLGAFLGVGKKENLLPGRQNDDFSSFRFFLRKVRSRHKLKKYPNTDITLEFLKHLWDKQEGICAISGVKMELPINTTEWEKTKITPFRASLDRLETRRPYMQDNVRFVSFMANMCKHEFSDEEVYQFCRLVTENRHDS